MSKNDGGETILVPESKEPNFPVNLTSWRHYTSRRLLCMVILAWTVLGFIETAYVTTVRISEIRTEARTIVCSRGRLGGCVDSVKRLLKTLVVSTSRSKREGLGKNYIFRAFVEVDRMNY